MGTSSTKLFGDDVACEVRDDYVDLLRAGFTGKDATKELLAGRADEIADVDDGPVIWLALAATQWKHGRLETRVKKKALKLIESGVDLRRWEESGNPRLVAQRQRVLDELRKQLESPQPPEKKVRVVFRKPPERLKKIELLWTPGQVVAYRRDSGNMVLFLTEAAVEDPCYGHIPYFALLDWQGKELPAPAGIQNMAVTQDPFDKESVVIAVWPGNQPAPLDRIERLNLFRDTLKIVRITPGTTSGRHFPTNWKKLDKYLDVVLSSRPESNSPKPGRD